jgi:hypothetical protein
VSPLCHRLPPQSFSRSGSPCVPDPAASFQELPSPPRDRLRSFRSSHEQFDCSPAQRAEQVLSILVLLQTLKMLRCTYTDLPDFDSVPSWMLYKLSKKQEETTRSLEKIERGTSHFARLCKLLILVCYAIRLRLVEYGDRPEILKQMAKRALDSEDKGGAGGHDD